MADSKVSKEVRAVIRQEVERQFREIEAKTRVMVEAEKRANQAVATLAKKNEESLK